MEPVLSFTLKRLLPPCWGVRRTIVSATVANKNTVSRPFKDIPEERQILFGNTINAILNYQRCHEYWLYLHRKHGPIFRQQIGKEHFVFVADPQLVTEVVRNEGKYPSRGVLPVWDEARKDMNELQTIANRQGEYWQCMRRKMNRTMLNSVTVNTSIPDVSKVSRDFIQYLQSKDAKDGCVHLNNEMCKWSLETFGQVFYGRRFGGFTDDRIAESTRFIDAVMGFFETTEELMFIPPKVARIFWKKSWQRHLDVSATVFTLGRKYVNDYMKNRTEENKSLVLDDLIFNNEWESEKEMTTAIIELMGGGIDTTSNSSLFAIYLLSRHPEIQDKLYDELTRILPEDGKIPDNFLKEALYLKAVCKETQRLYPVGTSYMRQMPVDISLNGHHVPKGTYVIVPLYALARMDSIYFDAERFAPERWIRNISGKMEHPPFVYLPFGVGPRMCIGRRFAELDVNILVALLYRNYKTELFNDTPLEVKTRLILRASTAVKVRLIPRKSHQII
ncbi:hypothetical protein ACJMK2_017752 [Sinanodonta woodiana]|uniref:Cytochrome P450 n=1 Tax=Sinanodonta woodiana TaxID=1069815 RepID=A0ABD3UDC7_SINWO